MSTIKDKVLVSEEEINEPDGAFAFPKMRIIDYVEEKIRKNIEKFGDSTWLTDVSTDKSMSYSQLLSSIQTLAGSFLEKGLGPGDKILIMASNFIEVPIAFLSAWKAGATVACLTLNLLKGTIQERVQQLRPKFIITDELRISRVAEAARDLDFVKEIFITGNAEGFTSVGDLLLRPLSGKNEIMENMKMDDCVAWLMYSSGTTGIPKAIVHTEQSIIGTFHYITKTVRTEGLKILTYGLMINTGGMISTLACSLTHTNIYCTSDLNDEKILENIDRIKPFAVGVHANQITWICRHPYLDKYDVSSVGTLMTLGSKIHSTYERQIFDKLPNLLFINTVYGSSEINYACSSRMKPEELMEIDSRTDAIAKHVFESCGKVSPYCKIKVVDRETDEKLGPGEEGEICVQSPFMFKEYLDMPEETALVLRDGWCYTGDKGYYDNNGNVFIVGRYKEFLKYRNQIVVPTSIEKEIMTHSAVEDVGVVGLPHEFDGQLPLAFVVKRAETTVTPEELIDFTNERVSDEEKLRGGVRFIEKIPRNELGKIVRHELIKLL